MSDYVGRHRPPTRAERRALEGRKRLPKALTAGYALPTAAAATLVISAGGATAAQSASFGVPAGSPMQAALAAPADGQAQTLAVADPALTDQAKSDVATTVASYSDLAERRQASNQTIALDQGRTQESQRVARDNKRKELAKAKAEAKKAGLPDGTTLVDGKVGDEQGNTANAKGWVMPLANPQFTSGYGARWGRLHAGNDFGCPVGTPLMAMSTGKVIYAGQMQGYGTTVDIEYADGTVSRYGHMSSISATVGQTVAPGQVVGLSGNTGRSTGPHLHLEIHPAGGSPVDPRPWLAAKGLVY